MRPPATIRAAKESRYPVRAHWMSVVETSRSSAIWGMATVSEK